MCPDRDTWAQGQQWARMLPEELARQAYGTRLIKICKEDTISREKTRLPKRNTVLISLRAPFQESPKFLFCSICFVRTPCKVSACPSCSGISEVKIRNFLGPPITSGFIFLAIICIFNKVQISASFCYSDIINNTIVFLGRPQEEVN